MGKSSRKEKKKKRNKVILPPELPPEIPDDEVQVSDDDLQFVADNSDYAVRLSQIDTPSITKHVTRVAADVKEDALEALYEKRLRKRSVTKLDDDDDVLLLQVDALPVKTLDGKLYYKTAVPKASSQDDRNQQETIGGREDDYQQAPALGLVKLNKSERRAKLKKSKKEAKKQPKEDDHVEQLHETPHLHVLAEVQKDLTAEEACEKKKHRLAELGTALLTDPEANIKSLKDMLHFSKDGDRSVVILALKSLLAVFKNIIPGYRIRLPTEKEQEMVVSKEVKRIRFFESVLLSVYKSYLQKLMTMERLAGFQHVVIRCICTLLEAVPHFNFRENLLSVVIKNLSSTDSAVRKLCCQTVKSLFTSEGKHGGEATVEAVQRIADLVKTQNCQLHPDSIEVFMSLSFDEDLGRPESTKADDRGKDKKFKKRKKRDEPKQLPDNEKKRSRKELMSKTREEVSADFKAASFTLDAMERRSMQSDVLSSLFQTYFRILKHTMQPRSEASSGVISNAFGGHPVLAPCLNGIGKFAHLIDLDFMADLMDHLQKLAAQSCSEQLTVTERLQCCIVAFKVMRNNLDALNVDLKDFFTQLYNLILEYRPGRDNGEVLAEALKIMLCDDRQHDMQRAAAFIKRLATFSLCFGSAESMAALVTLKHLLQKNVKCRNLLDNDAGGGSLSGPVAKYQPYASDPNLSGALASVLWELNLLSDHYHPAVSVMASSISNMGAVNNQVYHSNLSPQQAFIELSLLKEPFDVKGDARKTSKKKKRGSTLPVSTSSVANLDVPSQMDENEVRKKLSKHFSLIRDLEENEKLRVMLDQTKLSLDLYERYKKHK